MVIHKKDTTHPNPPASTPKRVFLCAFEKIDYFWGMEDFDFDIDISTNFFDDKENQDAPEEITPEEKKKARRRTARCSELSLKYEYRRAFSETKLLDCDINFKENHSYNFITAGDVDALSYLKLILRHVKKIDYLLFSTWCMSAEDIHQLEIWLENGTIKKMDAYLGEIFPGSYKIEWIQINEIFKKHNCGRIAIFRNHSKIFAGYSKDFYFGVQTSANINTNPRCENGCITINKDIFEFYKSYFDEIQSIK